MSDYTSHANAQDRAARLESMTPRQIRRLDPVAAHREDEARSCIMLTAEDVDALAARDAQRREIDRTEGRILTVRTPSHVNPHD